MLLKKLQYSLILLTLGLFVFAFAKVSIDVAVHKTSLQNSSLSEKLPSHDLQHCALCHLAIIFAESLFDFISFFTLFGAILFLFFTKFKRFSSDYYRFSSFSRAPPLS